MSPTNPPTAVDISAPVDWPERLAQLADQAVSPSLRKFYQAGCVAPETALAEVPLVALDFETTGLAATRHSIVSIGLVPFSLGRIRCSEARHWLVKPRLPLHQTSIAIHGITHQDVEQAPDLEVILDEVLAAMAGKTVVVHYRGIERPFFDIALKARLDEGIEFPIIDTMAIEHGLYPKRRRSWFNRILGRRPVSLRLADSRARYGLPLYSQHHAVTDALASAELLQAQVQYHFTPETPVAELWC